MVKIRLSRFGRKHLPHYKVIVTKAREKRETDPIEFVGSYSPITKEIILEKERIEYWLSVGANPSDTVKRLLIKEGLIKAPKATRKFNKEAGKKATERKQRDEEAAQAAKEAEAKPEAETTEEATA